MDARGLPTVLVVDDDVANLRVFERVFRKRFHVVSASSGNAALALLAGLPSVEVAFVDFLMPGLGGAAVLAALRERRPEIARYLLTGLGDADETAAVLRAGLCRAILQKPWDRAAIEAAVADALASATAGPRPGAAP